MSRRKKVKEKVLFAIFTVPKYTVFISCKYFCFELSCDDCRPPEKVLLVRDYELAML